MFQNHPPYPPCYEKWKRERSKTRGYQLEKNLIERSGLPFSYDDVQDAQGVARVSGILSGRPEMQERRFAKQLNGLYLADTLYLPEDVKVTGTTFIFVHHVVMEGRCGYWSPSTAAGEMGEVFLSTGTMTSLGTTLDSVLKKNGLERQGFEGKDHLPPYSVIKALDLGKYGCLHGNFRGANGENAQGLIMPRPIGIDQ